jgi:hypothetical protein
MTDTQYAVRMVLYTKSGTQTIHRVENFTTEEILSALSNVEAKISSGLGTFNMIEDNGDVIMVPVGNVDYIKYMGIPVGLFDED